MMYEKYTGPQSTSYQISGGRGSNPKEKWHGPFNRFLFLLAEVCKLRQTGALRHLLVDGIFTVNAIDSMVRSLHLVNHAQDNIIRFINTVEALA